MSRYIGNYLRVPGSEPQQASAPGIWSLSEQLAYQRANVWPPARDPYYNQTVLHLSGDVAGTRETNPVTQPRTFLSDASTNNFLLTPNGDVSARPFSPYQHSYSVYFGGNYGIETTGVTAIGTNDFAIEVFVYPTAYTYYAGIFGLHTNSTAYGPAIFLSTTGEVNTGTRNGTGTIGLYTSSANAAPLNTWTHIVLTRISGVMKTYINGVLLYSVANTTNCDSTLMAIGQQYADYSPSGRGFTGYISNARAISGINSVNAFTGTVPTTKLQKITGTFILACHSNRWNYDEGSNYTISADSGTPVVSANSPFVEYDTTSGSGYFDGSDYLSFTTSSNFALTGDFTVECWAYFTSSASLQPIIDQYTSAGFLLFVTPGSTINGTLYINSSAGVDGISSFTGTSCPINAWNFFRVIRSGSTVTVYCNGVSVGSRQRTGNVFVNSTALKIGNYSTSYFTGYLSDIRIVTSALTGTEVPTAPLTPVSGTQLLTLQTRAPANNQGILDTSPNNFVVTRTGNVAQGSFSPFSASGWSNYFGGSPDFLSGSGQLLGIGSNDFTVEAWVFLPRLDGVSSRFILGTSTTTSSPTGIYFSINTNGGISSAETWGINVWNTTGLTFTVGTWNHVALCRSGNTARAFLNGVQATNTGSFSQTYNSTSFVIGRTWTTDAANSSYMIGNISNLRVISGQALYSGNFTPPTRQLSTTQVGSTGAGAASSITGTVTLLTCQDNRFRDNSNYNRTISVGAGTPSVQPFSQFAPTQAYVASQLGGSGYFDGNDYLSIPDSEAWHFGTGDFTVEAWYYPTTTSAQQIIIGQWSGSVGGTGLSWVLMTSNDSNVYLRALASTDGSGVLFDLVSTSKLQINAWNHVVLVRSGSTFQLYINGAAASSGSTTSSSAIYNSPNILSVGSSSAAAQYVTGYVSGVRVVKGTAVYSGTNYVVPTAPPTAIPNTSLLLNFTAGGIVDATGKNNLETVGKVQIATAQAKWDFQRGGAALQFDGSGYLAYRNNPVNAFGTGDFTIELWVYHTSLSGQQTYFSDGFGASAGPYVYKDSSNLIGLYYSSQILTASSAIAANTWYHVAVVRQAGTVKLYIDGVQKASNPDTTNLTSPIQYVGNDGSSGAFSGYMTARVTNSARYTGSSTSTPNFTLPTGPFPIG